MSERKQCFESFYTGQVLLPLLFMHIPHFCPFYLKSRSRIPPLLSFLPKSQIKDLSPLCLEILLLFYCVTNTIIKELNVK